MPRLRIAAIALLSLFFAEGRVYAQERGGFTARVDLGLGIQKDRGIEETGVGLAGLNVGVGGFVTRDVALMFRLVGTNVSYDFGSIVASRQVSGVGGSALQLWVTDRFNVEAGGGFGFWTTEGTEVEAGPGLILGAGAVIFNRGKHNLQIGIQYAPAFTEPGTVHNIGFTFGYQFL